MKFQTGVLFKNISVKQTIVKNSLWLSAGQFVAKFIRFFLVITAANVLGPESYGVFTYTSTLVGFFFILTDMGLSGLFIREYHRPGEIKSATVATIIGLKIGAILLGVSFAYAYSIFGNDTSIKSIFFILLINSVLGALRDIFILLTRANNRLEYDALSLIIEATVSTAIGLAVLLMKPSLPLFSVAYLAGTATALLFISARWLPFFPNIRAFRFSVAPGLLSASIPFLVDTILIVVLTQTDVLFLKWLKGTEAVGVYAAGMRLFQVLFIIPTTFALVLLPLLSSIATRKDLVLAVARKAMIFLCMLGIPIACLIFSIAPSLFRNIFGPAYDYGVPAFQALILGLPFAFVTMAMDAVLLTLNFQKQNIIYTSSAAAVNLLLNILLIPIFSLEGAAVATTVANIVNFSLTFRLLAKIHTAQLLPLQTILVFLGTSLFVGAAAFIMTLIEISVFVIIPVALLVYCLLLIFFRESNMLYAYAHGKRYASMLFRE